MRQFDFEQVGRRMPYSVPEEFFDKLEADVMREVKAETTKSKNHKKTKTIAIRSALAIAAVLTLFFVVRTTSPTGNHLFASADDFASVELAFNKLSADDQDFLLQVYEDEEYMNVLTNIDDYE